MQKKPSTINVTMQRRTNPLGLVKFRALVVINDFCIDGWGDTPELADAALKLQMAKLALEVEKQSTNPQQLYENNKTSN